MKLKIFTALLLTTCLSGVYAQELPIKDLSKEVNVPESTLQSYTGHYKITAMSLVIQILLENGSLVADVAGMGKISLTAGTQTAFSAKEIQAQLEFADIEQKAKKLILYQAGSILEGTRIAPPKELDYETILVGSTKVNYATTYIPFESEWDLVINDQTVGTATIHLRHAIYQGKPAYHGGSVIRYNSMGNKPFADMGFFSKKDYSPLQMRNAISQEEEILSVLDGNALTQITMNINNGHVSDTKTVNFEQTVFGAGIYKLLSMELNEGMTVKFPVSGLTSLSWEKALVASKETINIEEFDETFETWRIEYSSGTVKWITDTPPYLVKWQMPTGMQWKLKSLVK